MATEREAEPPTAIFFRLVGDGLTSNGLFSLSFHGSFHGFPTLGKHHGIDI